MATTRNQKLIIAAETMEFVRLCDALACQAMSLGIDRDGFVSTLVSSWNDAAIKIVAAVADVEKQDKSIEEPMDEILSRITGKASN